MRSLLTVYPSKCYHSPRKTKSSPKRDANEPVKIILFHIALRLMSESRALLLRWHPQSLSCIQPSYMLHYQAKREHVNKKTNNSPTNKTRQGMKQGKKQRDGKNSVRCFPTHLDGNHVTNGKACASSLVLLVNMKQMGASSVIFKGRFEQQQV